MRYFLLAAFLIFLSCNDINNDGIYNEETNRANVKRKKVLKDSIERVKDSLAKKELSNFRDKTATQPK